MVLLNISLPITGQVHKKGVSTDPGKTNYERMGG